ncbi:MAG: glycosyltransferase family 4 protein [Anaerolineae bacterium]|nr:glycosyltransferase family 4 protein [Anaerolineae bacterium]
MKIVLGVHHFPPTYTAGAELEAYRIACQLRARGHEVQVICVERIDYPTARKITWRDDHYDGIPVRRLFFNLRDAPDPFLYSYDNKWIGEHLETFFQAFQPDLFHLISGYLLSGRTIQVAHARQIPVVVSLMDFWFLCPRITMLRSDGQISTFPIDAATCARCLGEESRRFRLPGQLVPALMTLYWQKQTHAVQHVEQRQQFLRQTLNLAQAIICRSHFFQKTFTQAGIDPQKLVFSRQGWDFPQMDPALLQKKPSDHLRIGYVGQIAPHKGVHLLFEAVHKLPQPHLSVKVYGDTSRFPAYTAQLQKQVAQDRRLSLAGVYQAHEVSRIFQEIDLLVVPSLWYENSPNVILEALAHKTPVIVSDLGAMPELVQDGVNGLTFKMGDAAALAHQLSRFFTEPGLLAQLQAGIGPIKPVAQEIDELEAIYQQVWQVRE